jgi:hypothetical protein
LNLKKENVFKSMMKELSRENETAIDISLKNQLQQSGNKK